MNAKFHYGEDSPITISHKEETNAEVGEKDSEDDDSTHIFQQEDPVKDFLTDAVKTAIRTIFSERIDIVAIGDSLTKGVGDETDNGGYVGILDEHLNDEINKNVHFTNLGKPGNRSDQLLQRLEEEDIQAEIEKADIILITIGANDVMRVFQNNITSLSIDAFEEELPSFSVRIAAVADRITNLNEDANIYFIGFYNPYYHYFPDIEELDEIITRWNEKLEEVTKQYDHVFFIPIKDSFDDAMFDFLAEDNFHPNYQGYELIAEQITTDLIDKEGDLQDETE